MVAITLLQADSYALALLAKISDGALELDFFHATFAVVLSLSSIASLSALGVSPPWAVTGEDDPVEAEERRHRLERQLARALWALRKEQDRDPRAERGLKKSLKGLRRTKYQECGGVKIRHVRFRHFPVTCHE